MISIFLIISIFLQGYLSLLLSYQFHFFLPLVFIISIYPIYLKKNQVNKFYFICIIYGLIIDLIYTNTLVVNSLLFFIIGLFISWFYYRFSDNYFNILLVTLSSILIYIFLLNILYVLFAAIQFSIYSLFIQYLHSIIINILYVSILYFVFKPYKKRIYASIYS